MKTPSISCRYCQFRLQPGSGGARRRLNLCLHYTRAIDYFPCLSIPLCGHCSVAIMATDQIISSQNEGCTVILTDTPGMCNHSLSLLYMSPIFTGHWFCVGVGEMTLPPVFQVPVLNVDFLCCCDVKAVSSKHIMMLFYLR